MNSGCFISDDILCYDHDMRPNVTEMKLAVKKIAEENDLSLVLLFGSQARGKTHKGSDFDFGVMAQKRFVPREIALLSFVFSQALKIKDETIEILDLKSAPPLLLKEISKDAVLLYEKEPLLFARFKVYALKRYFEARPLLELRRLALNRSLKTA